MKNTKQIYPYMDSWFFIKMQRQFTGEKTAFSTNGSGKIGYPFEHTQISVPYLIAYIKIQKNNLKWICKHKTVKHLEENLSDLCDLSSGKDFFRYHIKSTIHY